MSQKMKDCLATIADAKNGEISGWSVATWLNKRKHRIADKFGIHYSAVSLIVNGKRWAA
jgi:hypothetical protein